MDGEGFEVSLNMALSHTQLIQKLLSELASTVILPMTTDDGEILDSCKMSFILRLVITDFVDELTNISGKCVVTQ